MAKLIVATFVMTLATTAMFAQKQGISKEDQAAIQELFKGVDKSKYRLQFNGGTQTVGTRKVAMKDLETVKKVRNPVESAGYIVLIVEGKDVVYVLAVGSKELTSVLGKEKVAKLNSIMTKYQ